MLQKPQTVAASSIYSMYTQQATLGKGYQPGGQGTLPRTQPRGALMQLFLDLTCVLLPLGEYYYYSH